MVNLVKSLVKVPKNDGKSGPPEVLKYQKVSSSHPTAREGLGARRGKSLLTTMVVMKAPRLLHYSLVEPIVFLRCNC